MRFVVIALILIPLWSVLRRDYAKGLALGTFWCVLMPGALRMELPGLLPDLTLQRMILLSLATFWFLGAGAAERNERVPLMRFFFWWSAVNAVSLATGLDFVAGVKRYLEFVLEVVLFYWLASKTLTRNEDAFRVVRAICWSLAVVAVFAALEKYTGSNIVDRFYPDLAGTPVRSTYPHRILLGTVMSMGWPLVLAWVLNSQAGPMKRVLLWGSCFLQIAGCYFANSRGPWLATVGAGLVLVALGSTRVRKAVAVLAFLGIVGLIARPGVLETITSRAQATLDSDSLKGGNFQYRLELWKVAFSEISKSPWRFLFGYGPASGSAADLKWDLSYRNESEEIWSWDSDLAYCLFQSGVVGLGVTLGLYGSLLFGVLRVWRRAELPERDILAGVIAALCVYVFMLTNVLMFAKQTPYLFWGLVAVGFMLNAQRAAQPAQELAQEAEIAA
jgi:hypothetical protein